MNREEAVRLLEERDARLSVVTRALLNLHRATETVISPDPTLSLATLEAKLALEHEGVMGPPEPPSRESLCQRQAWCISHDGHVGRCERVEGRPAAVSDFGPDAAKRRRY